MFVHIVQAATAMAWLQRTFRLVVKLVVLAGPNSAFVIAPVSL